MKTAPVSYYRQLERGTLQLFIVTLVFLGLTVLCALLGFSQGVISLRGATSSLAYAFAVLFAIYTVASLFRWIGRRRPASRQGV